jgi:hypothetical protein
MINIRRRRILEYTVDGNIVTVRWNKDTIRVGGTVQVPNKVVTPTGTNTGKIFTFSISPAAIPNEQLDISFSVGYFTYSKAVYAHPLKNNTTVNATFALWQDGTPVFWQDDTHTQWA